ncbi:hypothetical protein FK220_007065 [Flavobacteriaceae bacterium TP-CH-4]|uniref:AlgX/AlgJ SGNH hydrolase-like domain-containing protein n=1 Tax=Pelagihabitans pacificus TaxID=2696054 RepID=A0A967ARS3_9FLAO|nr:hypothetical protein [Pelagihabitans pacificus]NHF59093.1 hypothetical protein [Pelagihabitans pacificus]
MILNNIGKRYLVALLGMATFLFLANYLKKSESKELEQMVVVLNAKVPQDDVFQLFYWERGESKFQIANSVRTKVTGSQQFQNITFELPNIYDLFRLRLDIGENLNQGTVNIKQIRFIKKGGALVYGIEEFKRLFAPNKYVAQSKNGSFEGKRDTINMKPVYDPYFISVDSSTEMESISENKLTQYPYLISAFICLAIFLFVGYNVNRISVSPEALFVGAFVLILILPTLQNQLQLTEPLENLEKRELAEMPEYSWSKSFTREFETYYNDNFGLRNNLVNWGGTYRTKLFRSSIHPELVKFGKKKWLFYNKMEGSRMFKSYARTNLLPQDTLRMVINKWEDKKKRFDAEGRKYFLSFWPNKHSIYPEYLPITMKVQIKDTLSRVDQILQQLAKDNSPIKLHDVRPELLQSKGEKVLYHKFDSHWNDYGAFLAYRSFFNANKEALGMLPKSEEDFEIRWEDYSGGEFIQMLGVRNKGFFKEKNPKFTIKENKDQIEYLPIDGFPRLTVRTRNEHCGNKIKALIFRDSFSNSLIQFFSLHFYEVTYIWGYKEYYVGKVQPDIIIEGFVEREIGEKIK